MSVRFALLIASVMAAHPEPSATPAPPTAAMTLDQIAWLAGCWSDEQGSRRVEEQWMAPAGGTMLGMSRTVKDGRTTAFEQMRIEIENGVLVFTARPSGQPEASFRVIQLSDDAITFSNPDHDFPQRVIYRKVGDGEAVGRIEGVSGGKSRAIDFPMRRTTCPAAVPRAVPATRPPGEGLK